MTTTTETIAALKAARELISDPAKWTQSAYARDGEGSRCNLLSTEARQFCALGALNRSTMSANNYLKVRRELIEGLADYNDTHSHGEVLALFDSAIARLEAQP